MQKRRPFETTSASLHIMAMAFMLCDHIWGTLLAGNDWLTCIGRLAFPIFAFLIVEGYHHTSDFKKYLKRILIFAVISEIPFNLMHGGYFYPLAQNVLWTFAISLLIIRFNERVKERPIWIRMLTALGSVAAAFFLGTFSFCDYGFAGVATVLSFYLLRGDRWYHKLSQLVILWYIHGELLGGLSYVLELPFGEVLLPRQGFAILALIPIWLYRGKKGSDSKLLRQINYWFYPVHMAVLGIIAMVIA